MAIPFTPQQNTTQASGAIPFNPSTGTVGSAPLANSQTSNQIGGLTSSGLGSVPVLKQITQLGTGIGSGVGQAGLGLLSGATRLVGGIQDIVGKGVDKLSGALGHPVAPGTTSGQQARDVANTIDTAKTNIFQKPVQQELNSIPGIAGNIIGQAAPYALGVGEANATVGNGVKGLIQGSGALPAIGRTVAGALTEGGLNAGEGYLLSGGDKKAAVTQGLTAGLLDGVTSGIGEAANATKTPEGLMMKVFKTDAKEQASQFRNPNSDTLARQALDKGIKGNAPEMATQLMSGLDESEKKVAAEIQKAGNPMLKLEEPERFINAVQSKIDLLEKSGATQTANGLKIGLQNINPETGEIPANAALSLRRFMDGLTNEKSFLQPTEELNAQQAGLKEMGDEIRHKINAVGGTGDVMKDYQFYTKALQKLTKYAVSKNNGAAFNIIQQGLLGDALIHSSPLGVGAVIGNKLLGTASGSTNAAQLLKNLPASSGAGATARAAAGQLLSR